MINVFGSMVGAEELAEIKSSIESQWLGMGRKVERFEKRFSERLGQRFLLIDNCSNGLYLAVKMLNLPEGSEVIVPANTWVSCGSAVVLNGLTPVFADCSYDDLNINRKTIKEVITPKTKAIMVVHYAGYPAFMKEIKEFGLPVIEDTAHAADSRIGNKYCGTIGDIGVFSFDSMKNIACGELGGITSPDDDLMDLALKSRYCGLTKSGLQAISEKDRWWEYELNNFNIKMLPNDIMASIALAQLDKLPQMQEKRERIYNAYLTLLSGTKDIEIPLLIEDSPLLDNEDITHSYFTIAIRVKGGKRDGLAKHLLNNGIYTTLRYQPLHIMKGFNKYYRKPLPAAEQFNEEGLNLPLHPRLSLKEVKYIVSKIKELAKIKLLKQLLEEK